MLADYIGQQLVSMDDGKRFKLMSATQGNGLPLVAWRLQDNSHFDEFAISHALRERGWTVPAYTLAPNAENTKLLRIVLRSDFSRDRAEGFLRDLRDALKRLDKTPKAVLEHQASERSDKKVDQSGSKHVDSHKFADIVKHAALQAKGKTQPIC